ncbi:alpha/beta fold hydrolase [Clostridium vincentii]|uniref:Pimeloyl-[acyl-carrier protein] methyl ester esterase n=1 Tax=Clostridium vincentii TaxID=52704 RepID=A0A2T0BL15_9CLOT|nr:alpha/beta hydrolase [Clostridium vincentii]PRR84571.1 Pimeloyl-[acyl-carrier protein] methyl ester esterase [Clostridium vincentii]
MNNPYLIMLPGWGMKSFVWKRINEFLSKDFELIFIEWDNVHSVDDFKQRVIRVIEQKKLASFSILGWSLGALVAQEIAIDNIYKINNIILIGGTSSFVQHKEDEYNIGWDKRIVERMKFQLLKRNPQETLLDFNNAMFSKSEKQIGYDKEFMELIVDTIENQSINSLVLGLDYLIKKDLRNKLIDIDSPLLMIHGEEDSMCPLESTIYIKNIISHSKIEVIKNGGHIPFFTNPNDCYNAISKFIKKKVKREEKL